MKQVFEQYASAVIAVFLSLFLIAILWKNAFFQGKEFSEVLGQVLDYSIGTHSIVENDAFEEQMNVAAPTIREKNVYVAENKNIFLSDCFEAKSKDGAVLQVVFDKLWKLDGTELEVEVSSDKTSICVPKAGVYWIQVSATAENKKSCSVISKLLVNER